MDLQLKFFDMPEDFDLPVWRECGRKAARANLSTRREANLRQWYLGDWLVAGEKNLKQRKLRREAKEVTGYPWGTLKNFAWIAKTFPPSRRRDRIPWSHHREVAKLDENTQNELLDKFRQAIQKRQIKGSLHELRLWIKNGEERKIVLARQAAGLPPYGATTATVAKIKVTFDESASDFLNFLFNTEKAVHGKKDVESVATWLMIQGIKSIGWEDKGKEFFKARQALFAAEREAASREREANKNTH